MPGQGEERVVERGAPQRDLVDRDPRRRRAAAATAARSSASSGAATETVRCSADDRDLELRLRAAPDQPVEPGGVGGDHVDALLADLAP